MQVFTVKGVNGALPVVLRALLRDGVVRDSRNGPVLAFEEPVTTVYTRPTERVLFSHMRRANPVFHFLESLWMLAGRRDVAFPATIVKNMRSFTDDGKTFHGAYGHRWRHYFGHDQIHWVTEELRKNPDSRRAVLQMWDGIQDPIMASSGGKDVPCNTSIYFDRRRGKLNMLVSCRSNDIIWGAYGANAVHMSILQEFVAHSLGIPVGEYRQVSNDLHLYLNLYAKKDLPGLADDCERWNYYAAANINYPLFQDSSIRQIEDDLHHFFHRFDKLGIESFGHLDVDFQTSLFNNTVLPMTRAWLLRKDNPGQAVGEAAKIFADDWRLAVGNWLAGVGK